MYKQSLFSGRLMTLPPNEIIFEPGEQPFWDEFTEWRDLGNNPEYLNYFPGEEEAEQKRVSILQEIVKYSERALDGVNYYYKIMAELRWDEHHNIITHSDFEAMQTALVETRNELITGQWDLALEKFQQSSMSQSLQDLYYDSIVQKLIEYINMSYTELAFKIGIKK